MSFRYPLKLSFIIISFHLILGPSKSKSPEAQGERDFDVEEVLKSKDRIVTKAIPNSVRKRKEEQAMAEKIASCSEDHSSDADSDKSNAEDTIVIIMRNKKKVLRKRKRPRKRSGSGGTSMATMSESDDANKDELLKKSRNSDNLGSFSGGSEVDRNTDLSDKVVVDTLDRVKQEAIAMNQPVSVDQQVPSTTSALLAQRGDKDVGATASSRKYSLAGSAVVRTAAESGDSSHDEDDSDIVGAVAGGENASTVTSELGK